jgi:FixJ family two-component response regulator
MRVLLGWYESLTHREREVMAKVIEGRMNKLIAHDLGISLITVKAHRSKVMRKMKAASLAHLVNMGVRLDAARWAYSVATRIGQRI